MSVTAEFKGRVAGPPNVLAKALAKMQLTRTLPQGVAGARRRRRAAVERKTNAAALPTTALDVHVCRCFQLAVVL